MIPGRITKRPNETYLRGIDFKKLLKAGETINAGGSVVIATDINGADASTDVLSGSPIVAGSTLSMRWKKTPTINDRLYLVKYRIETSGANAYDEEFVLEVKEAALPG